MRQLALKTLLILTMATIAVACDSVIYDDEGDCSVSYRLKFRYDMNMKFADAFSNEVKSVAVYAFDLDGKLVWQGEESGDALAADGYSMNLDLQPGDYQLVAWCGLKGDLQPFSATDMQVGVSTISDLKCQLSRSHDSNGEAYVDRDLNPLFYGELSVNLPANDDGGEYTYEMPLTKDTNHLRIILQQLSGEDVDVDDFTFEVASANGLMNYDNSLLDDETITYRAWNTESGQAGIGDATTKATDIGDATTKATTSVSVAIADLTFGRLTTDHSTTLTVKNKEGEVVISIPVVDYALLVKGYYNQNMTSQEYLDRQDDYSMTFFLDKSGQWVSGSVIINSWRVVLQTFE